jgi:hypothetical protein
MNNKLISLSLVTQKVVRSLGDALVQAAKLRRERTDRKLEREAREFNASDLMGSEAVRITLGALANGELIAYANQHAIADGFWSVGAFAMLSDPEIRLLGERSPLRMSGWEWRMGRPAGDYPDVIPQLLERDVDQWIERVAERLGISRAQRQARADGIVLDYLASRKGTRVTKSDIARHVRDSVWWVVSDHAIELAIDLAKAKVPEARAMFVAGRPKKPNPVE